MPTYRLATSVRAFLKSRTIIMLVRTRLEFPSLGRRRGVRSSSRLMCHWRSVDLFFLSLNAPANLRTICAENIAVYTATLLVLMEFAMEIGFLAFSELSYIGINFLKKLRNRWKFWNEWVWMNMILWPFSNL